MDLQLRKDKVVLQLAVNEIEARGSESKKINTVLMNLSASYISSGQELFRQSDIVFDRFHLDHRRTMGGIKREITITYLQ